MERKFRLYNSYNSSFYDLIDGERETKQTMGLGLLLSKSPATLKAFLAIPAIALKVGKVDWSGIDRLVVNCELTSKQESKVRADILLRLYNNGDRT